MSTSRYTTHTRVRAEKGAAVEVPWDVKLMHVTGSCMFALLSLGLVFTVFWAAVHLPVFNLVGITVEGEVDHNNATTLRANVTTRMTGNFFTADLRQVRNAFEGVPWVRLATVQREFPNRLRVTLQEHRPVAYWGDENESRLLNMYGEVFEANLADLENEKIPRLKGPDSESQLVWKMYQALVPMFSALTLDLGNLELTERGSWRAYLKQGAVIELGRGDVAEVTARMERVDQTLLGVVQKLGRKLQSLQSLDLRHDNGYAIRLHGVSTIEAAIPRN
jgi:cell division protein FtsQ